MIALTLFAAAAAAAVVPIACGGDDNQPTTSVCGNGIRESGEECDLGANNGKDGYSCSSTCKSLNLARSSLNVSWSILKQTNVDGFDGSTCAKIGAEKAHIIVVGPNNLRIEQTVDCTRYSSMISGVCFRPDGGTVDDCSQRLPLGDYKATVFLERGDLTSVTAEVTSATRQNAQHGATINLLIDFGYDSLNNKGTLRGSLLVDVSWGENGKKCDTATPPVEKEAFRLTVGSSSKLATGMSLSGTRLDATPNTCFIAGVPPNQNRLFEEIPDLGIGQYVLLIQGFPAGASSPLYCKRLDVFVGPGSNNAAFKILVPAVVNSDAGMCN